MFSPYAIRHALGMAATGAKGRTQKQLGKVPDPWTSKRTPSYKLMLASRLWVQRGYPILEGFMNQSEANFGVRPWIVDFTQAPDFLANQLSMAGWKKEQTARSGTFSLKIP